MPETVSDRLATYLNDPANPVKLHLFKNELADDLQHVAIADLTEADFDGYAPITFADYDPVEGASEVVGECLPQEQSFAASQSLATPQMIYGGYVVRHQTGGDPQLLSVKVFDPPITVVAPGQEITYTPRVYGMDF